MWVCKFKVYDKDSMIAPLVKESKVELYYYPIKQYTKGYRYFFVSFGVIKGKEEDKEQFCIELKKLQRATTPRKIEYLGRKDDFLTLITSHTMDQESRKNVKTYYNAEILHLKPILFRKDGWEEWEVAALDKKSISQLLSISEKNYVLQLQKLAKGEIKNIGFLTVLPALTEKQNNALQLALEKGYYQYPREISLDKLAKIAKLSFSTFQAHVKKAENKIISYVIGLNK